MRFCRNHPCFGWLSLEPQDYRFVYNKLIEMRDADLKAGDNSSGFPSGFPEWCETNLKELAKQARYKKRIEEHLAQLKMSIEEVDRIGRVSLKFIPEAELGARAYNITGNPFKSIEYNLEEELLDLEIRKSRLEQAVTSSEMFPD